MTSRKLQVVKVQLNIHIVIGRFLFFIMSRIEKKDIISDEALDALAKTKSMLQEIIELKSIAFNGCCNQVKVCGLQEQ
jgi:hypothetical protein